MYLLFKDIDKHVTGSLYPSNIFLIFSLNIPYSSSSIKRARNNKYIELVMNCWAEAMESNPPSFRYLALISAAN